MADKKPPVANSTNQQRKPRQGFQPGVSGNPAGRPEGSRNKVTIACEQLLDGQAEAITQKALKLALAGDMVALRLCLERIVPVRRESPLHVNLPDLNGVEDLPLVQAALLAAIASGEILPTEATAMSNLLEGFRRAVEIVDIEERLKVLEGRAPQRRGAR